jgi:hypothetical protein
MERIQRSEDESGRVQLWTFMSYGASVLSTVLKVSKRGLRGICEDTKTGVFYYCIKCK